MNRLTDDEIILLLKGGESDRIEYKESFKGDVPTKARRAVCAFANDLPNHKKPGILIIGLRDNGEPSNYSITDSLLRSLTDMARDGNIVPLPVLSVEKRTLKNTEMAVVTVMPSDMPPIRYDGQIWIRIGPRQAIANRQEERILNEKRRYKDIPFDICPVPSGKISDLSKSIFENDYLPAAFSPDVLKENNRSYEEQLSSCKMIVSPDDTTPTILGLLAIGKSSQDFIPGASIQFLRINGTELTDDIIDEEKIGGNIAEVLRRIIEKLTSHSRTAIDVTSAPTHNMKPTYPMTAIHQIVYNAVMHRTYEGTNAPTRIYWYNDRIEITSPGGPYGNVTPENFGEPGITDYRNPNIADVMKTYGFVQAFGRGIDIARAALEENGNPKPEFEVDKSIIMCIIRNKKKGET